MKRRFDCSEELSFFISGECFQSSFFHSYFFFLHRRLSTHFGLKFFFSLLTITRLRPIFPDVLDTFQIDRNDCNFFRVLEINFGASLSRRSSSDQVLSFEPIWEISFFFFIWNGAQFHTLICCMSVVRAFFFVNGVACIQLSSAKIESWYAITMQSPVSVDYRFYIKIKGVVASLFVHSVLKKVLKGKILCTFPPKKYRLGAKVFG